MEISNQALSVLKTVGKPYEDAAASAKSVVLIGNIVVWVSYLAFVVCGFLLLGALVTDYSYSKQTYLISAAGVLVLGGMIFASGTALRVGGQILLSVVDTATHTRVLALDAIDRQQVPAPVVSGEVDKSASTEGEKAEASA